MEVLIAEQKKSIHITSVIISHPVDDPTHEKLHMFFCWNCQNPLFQYVGRVVSLMAGSTPNGIPIILKCTRCKNTLQIVDIV